MVGQNRADGGAQLMLIGELYHRCFLFEFFDERFMLFTAAPDLPGGGKPFVGLLFAAYISL